MADVLDFKKTSQKDLSVRLDITNKEFALKLYKDNKIAVSKTQIYFFLHNATSF